MTPCEKRGITKYKTYIYTETSLFPYGTKVKLSVDDGSDYPLWETADGQPPAYDGDNKAYRHVEYFEETVRAGEIIATPINQTDFTITRVGEIVSVQLQGAISRKQIEAIMEIIYD